MAYYLVKRPLLARWLFALAARLLVWLERFDHYYAPDGRRVYPPWGRR